MTMIGSLKKFQEIKKSRAVIDTPVFNLPKLTHIPTWTCLDLWRIPQKSDGHIVFEVE